MKTKERRRMIGVTRYQLGRAKSVYTFILMVFTADYWDGLKKNLNASKPSEHSPDEGGKVSKRLGGIIGCKDKTSSWHLIGFPDGRNIGSTVSCRGETRRYTVHLH